MSTGAATRLVLTIGVIKWVVIVSAVVFTALFVPFVAGDAGALFIPTAMFVVGAYVVLGWFQQSLLLLIGIAKNTAREPSRDALTGV